LYFIFNLLFSLIYVKQFKRHLSKVLKIDTKFKGMFDMQNISIEQILCCTMFGEQKIILVF
jgi:hypothetical protein